MKAASGTIATAMIGAGVVTAQLVSGKATRDALFLASLDLSSLPAMLVATSVCSILLVAANSRGGQWIRPAVLVPASCVASGVLFLVEWLLAARMPAAVAVAAYLHISGAGPLLASGFWLIASERFDPRTAKKRFGQIAAAGTLGGLLSALLAERVAAWTGVASMLPFLAAFNFLSAVLVRRLAIGSEAAAVPASSAASDTGTTRSGLRVIADAPYLRHLAALVLLGTTGAALVDYLFKAQAVATFGRGDQLLRFFAIYYAATSLFTFVVQTSSSRTALQRLGLGLTTSTPSWALLAGSLGGLAVPGFGSLVVARGGESVFRSSLFRAGYELFYTPMPAAEKRAAKSLIDVAFDRLGDAVGGGLVRLSVLVAPAAQSSAAILSLAMVCSAAALFAASRLNRGYVGTLGSSLIRRGAHMNVGAEVLETRTTLAAVWNRAVVRTASMLKKTSMVESKLSSRPDETTRSMMRRLLEGYGLGSPAAADAGAPADSPTSQAVRGDREVQDLNAMRSRDRNRVVEILGRAEGIPGSLVAHVIPLLAWDKVANQATFALKKIAEEHIGQLTDALIDPNQDFAVRRRLARVFSVCVSERAAAGVMLGLDDLRFDVRFQSARALASIVEKNPRVHIDRERIFEVVLKEVAVGRPVWESRRLLEESGSDSPIDQFVRDRAGEGLAHVFTLLSLVLEREPLQIAFRSLHTDDEYLRGTALEYLESVLPARIRQRLWPFLEKQQTARRTRPRNEVVAELLRS